MIIEDVGELARYAAFVERIVEVAVRDACSPKVPAEVREEARDWLQNGGLAWACSLLGLDHERMLSLLQERGVFGDPVSLVSLMTVAERQQQVVALRQEGKSYKEIGRLLGVSHQTVFRDLRAIEQGRHYEPSHLAQMIDAWFACYGDMGRTVRQVVDDLNAWKNNPPEGSGSERWAALWRAVETVATTSRGVLSTKRLGWWLGKVENLVYSGKCFVRVGTYQGAVIWAVFARKRSSQVG